MEKCTKTTTNKPNKTSKGRTFLERTNPLYKNLSTKDKLNTPTGQRFHIMPYLMCVPHNLCAYLRGSTYALPYVHILGPVPVAYPVRPALPARPRSAGVVSPCGAPCGGNHSARGSPQRTPSLLLGPGQHGPHHLQSAQEREGGREGHYQSSKPHMTLVYVEIQSLATILIPLKFRNLSRTIKMPRSNSL